MNDMKNYFTSIERANDQYIGTIHSASNNQAVYRTKEYTNHVDAINDVNSYLQSIDTNLQQAQPATYTVTTTQTAQVGAPVEQQPIAEPPRRCCGR